MRRNIKTPALAAAFLGLAAVGIGSLATAADGVTIADRMGNLGALIDDGLNVAPVQELANTCDASCELWARDAWITVPGLADPVHIWGFTDDSDPDVPPTLPGPTIVVEAGEPVTIKVTNELPFAIAGDFGVDFRSVPLEDRVPSAFPTEIPVGATVDYTFTTDQVGTSIYAANAANPNGNRQIAMGLAGVLVVRPLECPDALEETGGCAYGDPGTPGNAGSLLGYDAGTDIFNEEALVALNDIDLAYNNSVDPLAFDMTNYKPTAHLINGKVYPETDVIDTQMGHNLLLRYANLGLADHSMGLVGKHQRILGRDATALAHGSDDVTVPLNVGQTVDAMVSTPLEAMAGYRYPLADQARQPGSSSADGALTFLTVFGLEATEGLPFGDIWDLMAAGGDPGSGSETSGYDELVFAGSASGGPAFAEYSIDDPGTPLSSTGLPGVVALAATFDSFTGTIPLAELATLANGNHTLWVRFSLDGTTWGNPTGIAFTIDRAGPVVAPVETDVVYTDGLTDVAVTATADATLTGTGEVYDGIATIDICPAIADQPVATGIALVGNGPGGSGAGPIVELSGVVPAADVALLSEGPHVINVAARDTRNRWSNDGLPNGLATSKCGEGTIIVDRTAPATSLASVSPNPNDGTMAFPGINSYLDVVRITATVTDPTVVGTPSGVGQVEGFIDDGLLALPLDVADYGTGFLFAAADGVFDELVEEVYADIPLASVASMTPGDHEIWIHGQDRAGNWESFAAAGNTTITVLAGAPQVAAYTMAPTVGDPLTVEIGVTAGSFGVGVTITGFEYSIGAAPLAAGSGTPVPVLPADQGAVVSTVIGPLTLPPAPDDNVWVRAQDSLGVWSPAVGLPSAGTPTVGPSLLANGTPSLNPNNVRRRLSGTAVATAGTVAAVEYSIGASPAAAGAGTAITNVASTGAYSVTRAQNNKFPIGAVVWVRARDSQGNWGPATSVTVVGP